MQAEESTDLSWPREADERQPTSYEVLQVHPAAPLELITAAYWRLAGEAQSRRSVDKAAEGDLHGLTRAYQTLTNPELRVDYDRSIGVAEQHLAPQVPQSRSRGFFGRGKRDPVGDARVDYYEILRIIPAAEGPIVEEAYSTLRTYYVRLVQSGYSPIDLLDYLEEAYSVASDPELRARYDTERNRSPSVPQAEAAAAAPKPKIPEKPKPASAPARPKTSAVRASPKVRSPRSQGGSHLGAITGAFGAFGRQFSTMSKREQQHSDDRLSEREHDQVDTSEIEAALLQRISSSVEAPVLSAASEEAPRTLARLTVVDGPDNGKSFEIQSFPLTVGGGPDCDITLPGLAPEQARLLFRDGRFVVYNLAPPDPGTGAESEAWWIVENGGDLSLGTYRLRFTTVND